MSQRPRKETPREPSAIRKNQKNQKKNRRSLGINLPHTIIRIFNSRDDDEARQLTLALHLVFPKKVKVEGTS